MPRLFLPFIFCLVWLSSCQTNIDQDMSALSARIRGEKVPDVPLIGPEADPVTAVNLELVTGGLRKPVYLTHSGDGRLFVAEQDGRVRLIQNGQLRPEPFLDISQQIATDGSERGLLGLALHPHFQENGWLYVVYTNLDGDTEITRYTTDPLNPNRADPDSALLILFIDQPFGNHNGGQIRFGPDGYFYIGLGDGGAVSDPEDNGQDPNTILGAILRLDVDSAEPYAIPEDNPFAGQADKRGEVWAIGLRNPWAFTFDVQTHDLYISDVGQEGPEEINFQPAESPAGVNYGWPIREGSGCYEAENCREYGLRLPIFEYPHGEDGCAVIGGQVYRGRQHPEWQGNYFFSDYCSGIIWTLRYNPQHDMWERTAVYHTETLVSSIGADHENELYVIFYRTGEIYQIVP